MSASRFVCSVVFICLLFGVSSAALPGLTTNVCLGASNSACRKIAAAFNRAGMYSSFSKSNRTFLFRCIFYFVMSIASLRGLHLLRCFADV